MIPGKCSVPLGALSFPRRNAHPLLSQGRSGYACYPEEVYFPNALDSPRQMCVTSDYAFPVLGPSDSNLTLGASPSCSPRAAKPSAAVVVPSRVEYRPGTAAEAERARMVRRPKSSPSTQEAAAAVAGLSISLKGTSTEPAPKVVRNCKPPKPEVHVYGRPEAARPQPPIKYIWDEPQPDNMHHQPRPNDMYQQHQPDDMYDQPHSDNVSDEMTDFFIEAQLEDCVAASHCVQQQQPCVVAAPVAAHVNAHGGNRPWTTPHGTRQQHRSRLPVHGDRAGPDLLGRAPRNNFKLHQLLDKAERTGLGSDLLSRAPRNKIKVDHAGVARANLQRRNQQQAEANKHRIDAVAAVLEQKMQRVGYTAARYAWRPRLQMMKQQQQQQHDPSNERWNKWNYSQLPYCRNYGKLNPSDLPNMYLHH